MSMRELLHLGKPSAPVASGCDPIVTFQDEMNKLFSDFFGDLPFPQWSDRLSAMAVSTALDVTENDKEYRVAVEIPGMDVEDIQVSAAEGYVTICGEKKEESKEDKERVYSARAFLWRVPARYCIR